MLFRVFHYFRLENMASLHVEVAGCLGGMFGMCMDRWLVIVILLILNEVGVLFWFEASLAVSLLKCGLI